MFHGAVGVNKETFRYFNWNATEKALFLTRNTVKGANQGEGEESGREEGGGGGCKRRSRRRRRRSRRRDYVKTKCGVS